MSDTSYIKSLDGLRAVAIILVMTYHADITHFGWFGVQLFFVLSGFLITGILWKEKSKVEALSFKFKKFWIRRTLRIFPLYFGYLFFLGIIYVAFHFPFYYPTYIPYLATYTFNYTRTLPSWQGNPLFTHLWSLSIEEQFYLIFPLIVFLCPRKFIKGFMVTIICIAPLMRYFLGMFYTNKGMSEYAAADAVYWNTFSHLDAFFLGGIIPVFSLSQKIKRPAKLFIVFASIALLAGIWDFFARKAAGNYLQDLGYQHGLLSHYENVWHYTLLNFVFASFILMLANKEKYFGLKKIFETKWMVNIGRVSYGMYIFHWAILVYFYQRFFWSENLFYKILFFIPYVALVYFFSLLSYNFYESYFIKLKDKFFPAIKKSDRQIKTVAVSN